MKYIAIVALAGTAVLFAGAAGAQQGVDFSKVEIKTTDLGNKTYMLTRLRLRPTRRVGRLERGRESETDCWVSLPPLRG